MSEHQYSEASEMLYTGREPKGMNFNKPESFPYFPCTAFTANSLSEIKECYNSRYTYIRTNNPNRDALAAVVSYLEQGEKSLIFSSGMGAITTTCMALLKPGDEVICNRNIYGETFDVFTKLLPKFGVKGTLVNFDNIDEVKAAINPNVKMIYSEVCANPTMNLADIPTLSEIAHANGAYLMIDNTFTTPISIKPLTKGADIVINSLTKFMNGHSNALGGSITSTAEIIDTIQMSGMLSFIIPEGDEMIDKFMLRLRYAHYATTLGGLRTTLNHPVTSSHSHMPDAERRKMGITPGMFRLSVGIEDADDLIADFYQALEVYDN